MGEKNKYWVDTKGASAIVNRDNDDLDALDNATDKEGYVSRAPQSGKRGRPRNPRTGQVHARVYQKFQNYLRDEAIARGVHQGIIVEEALSLYMEQSRVGLLKS